MLCRFAAAIPLLLFWVIFTSIPIIDAFLGVNWGTIASHPIPPEIVVQLLKDNNFTQVKLFDADPKYVDALKGSGMEIMVAIPNQDLEKFSDSYDKCQEWVKENVTEHVKDGSVNIKYVAIGNEPFLTSYNGSYTKLTYPTLVNIQKALGEAGLGDKIKATVPFNADVYESVSNKPSGGDFRPDIKAVSLQIVKFLKQNNAPFVVNIYPFLSLYQNPDFPFEFAFIGNSKSDSPPVVDNNITYTNAFDANFDTLVTTLTKNGFPDMPIMIGEIGWPTDGNQFANASLAKKFYNGLFEKLTANKGTPLRPGPMQVYLFSLFDEDQKSIAPGFFERHWGIFSFDGKPKFPIDLKGDGQAKMMIGAKGVQYQSSQWCVLNPNVTDMAAVNYELGFTCANADCSSISPGSSCNIGNRTRASYAFNIYFQVNDQDVRSCNFNGLAEIVTTNPSTGTCSFPIQIVSDDNDASSLSSSILTRLFFSAGLLLSLLNFF
ncbi:hypothetical protein ACFE04_021192 [Oxalis oulophora]